MTAVEGRRAFVPRVRDRLSAALVEALGQDEVRRVVGRHVAELTGVPGARVLRPDLGGTRLLLHCHLDGPARPVEGGEPGLDLDHPQAPWVLALAGEVASGQPAALPGDHEQLLWIPMGADRDRWVLAAPIAPDADAKPLRADLRAIADEAWVALQRAELVGDLQDQLEIMSAITAVAGANVAELARGAERIARVACTSLSASCAVVYAFEDDRLGLVAGHGGDRALGSGLDLAIEVLRDGREVVVRERDELGDPGCGPWDAVAVGQLLGLPLRVAERTVGAMVLARPAGHPAFGPLTLQVGAALAQQAALAVDHALLLQREQDAAQRLRELDEMKGDWMAGLTHDLKAPLTGLVGFTRTMLAHDDKISAEDRRRYLESMDRQASRLVDMVEDLLLAARMDDGNVAPTATTTFELYGLVLDGVEQFGPEVRARLRVEGAAGPLVVGDRSQLLRVVTNLVDNACKYSDPADPVVLTVEEAIDERGRAVGRIVVDDHGPGIPPEERGRVFERFRRGQEGLRKGSTGLGLYIGRGIARGHEGDLEAGVAPGGGARLVLTVPLADVNGRPSSAVAGDGAEGAGS